MNLVTLCGLEFYPLYENIVGMNPDFTVRVLPDLSSVIRTAEKYRPSSVLLLMSADSKDLTEAAEKTKILRTICPRLRCFAAGESISITDDLPDVVYIGKNVSADDFMTLTSSISSRIPADELQAPMDDLEDRVTDIIRRVGIPPNVKGYRYLRSAIILAANDITILDNVMTVLYPTVAMSNNTTPGRVERAIRHAISIAWSRACGDVEYIERHLHCKIDYHRTRPSNSEFIALISDCLRLRHNK